MSQQPKIVRIIARLNVGGPAKHVVWLTAGLDDFDTLLVAGSVPAGEGDMGYFASESGVVPHIIPQMSREISMGDITTIWKLYRLFLRERPDLIHTHTAKAGTVGRVAGFFYRWFTPGVFLGRPRKTRFVHTYHGHIFHSYYGPLKTRLFVTIERALASLVTDRIVAVSEQQAVEINQKFGVGKSQQIKVIPLGLDLGVFRDHESRRAKFRRELGIGDKMLLVGIVGRLTEVKNHELFLKVVSRYKQTRNSDQPPVRFVVIGDGSLKETLENQSRAFGLANDVIFCGERSDPEYFYPALDVVALTSRNEGTPLTLIEAMANARPVIATSVGGVVDLLGPTIADGPFKICERGISVPPADIDAYAKGLDRLIADAALRSDMAAKGFEFAQAKYPKDRLLADMRSLYDELLDPQPRAITASAGHGIHSRV
jgi:glycosyltransferase involved in cell wall biosynthesis